LAHEVQGEIKGSPSSGRAEQWREPEPAADGEPEASWVPEGHHGVDTEDDRDPDFRDERAKIGKYLPRSIFPATGEQIVAEAGKLNAPDDVLRTLGDLDPAERYANAQELWASLRLSSGPRF
jgi:hypothetical protein